MVYAKDPQAIQAREMIRDLQVRFAHHLDNLSKRYGEGVASDKIEWLRAGGVYGGGDRRVILDRSLFDRGSVNFSQVHYESDSSKPLKSATAISTIIHPKNPYVPSIHIHISWTQQKEKRGYWRIMADLNPSIPNKSDTLAFEETLRTLSGTLYEAGAKEGDRYFWIPALQRTRGVKHFYLEGYRCEDFDKELTFAHTFGAGVIDRYVQIIEEKFSSPQKPDEVAIKQQRDYHTLYFFQVLTLDRGTTSGLLVHNENDEGILASLPSKVDTALLRSWRNRVTSPQEELVDLLLEALGREGREVEVDRDTKIKLAKAVRIFYAKHPKAIDLQARGSIIPPTIQNHTEKITT